MLTKQLSVPWRTLVPGDEQLYRPRGKSTKEISSPLTAEKMFTFMDSVAYRWGWYGCSPRSTKGLHVRA